MAITLELPPEIEANLAAQARAQGLELDVYLKSLLEQQAATEYSGPSLGLEQFEAELDRLAQDSENLPYLPADVLRRESFYQDHD